MAKLKEETKAPVTRGNNRKKKDEERTSIILGSCSVEALVKAKVIGAISVVRENENNYKFVTVLSQKKDAEGKALATNVYFGKKSSEEFAEGEKIDPKDLLEMTILSVEYSDGEERLKIATKNESEYTDLMSMLGEIGRAHV